MCTSSRKEEEKKMTLQLAMTASFTSNKKREKKRNRITKY